MDRDFWLLLAANLPLVAALLFALQKKWIVMGVTFDREMKNKDDEITFREQLRQEALADKKLVEIQSKEMSNSFKELTKVVHDSVALNERLMQGLVPESEVWAGDERRDAQIARRT